MTQIVAFAGSNSSVSINFTFLKGAVQNMPQLDVELLELYNSDIPLYQHDLEQKEGIPSAIHQLFKHISKSTGLVIAVNEHNSYPSAFFKNILDWLSRVDGKFLTDKKILLLSTSPGKRGGQSSLAHSKELLTRFGGEVIETFSLSSFGQNFNTETGQIQDEMLAKDFSEKVNSFVNAIAE
uniref:NADPH-dependent FMN reductase n=1 Tax=Flavobacterium sp. TaxID=239 RepID=UPI00404B888A